MRSFFLMLGLLAGWSVGGAHAQAVRLGAVLPLTGAHALVGEVQAAALAASVEVLASRGVGLELTLLDSASDPEEAAALVQTLLNGGVHALVCCETPEVAARVTPLTAGVVTLTLAPVTVDAPWLFSLAASETAALMRLLHETPLYPFGFMAPAGRLGNRAARMLQPAWVGVARYPAERAPLTPEALQVATREPASVVVWDEGEGSVRAADALAARGYEGVVVVRAAALAQLDALERAQLTGAHSAVSPAVLGYTLPDAHPSKEAVSSFRRALIGVPSGVLTETALAAGASAWDAAQLVGAAVEQLLAYGFTSADPKEVRGALRDALVGLGPVTGAGGTYDFNDGDASTGGLQPDSLVLAEWRSGRFRPLP